MSDIASPVLAVMDNEAHAFICFCGIMKRLEGNFQPDGQLMSIKFQHLKLLLQYSDPEFYSYLVSCGADDLFFCYRWLLLELKREFAFDDALRMLEITWSSLPPDPPETEVDLVGPLLVSDEAMPCRDKDRLVESCLREDEQKEKQRRRHMLRPSREEPYLSRSTRPEEKPTQCVVAAGKWTKANQCDFLHRAKDEADLCTNFERQTSFGEFKYYTARNEDDFDMKDSESSQENECAIPHCQATIDSEDDPGEATPLMTDCDNGFSLFYNSPTVWKADSSVSLTSSASPSSWPGASPDSLSKATPTVTAEDTLLTAVPKALSSTAINSPAVKMPPHSQNPSLLPLPILSTGRGPSLSAGSLPSPGNRSPSTTGSSPTSTKMENGNIKPCSLPPPQEFGKGNPFMLFLCLSILLEHRDHIIKNSLDYNELAMHFDRLVRRHNLSRVLQRAKALFADYLQSEVWDSEEGDEVSSDSPTRVTAAQHSRPVYSPLASPHSSSPNSTYNLATTVPSPTADMSLSPS